MKQRSPIIFIFLTVFIDLLGVGIVLPLLPYYVKIVEQSTNLWLVDNRALIVGALTSSFALMQFLFAPVFGALSDRYGRRPLLLFSMVGTAISYVMFAFADRLIGFGIEAVLAMLFASRIVAGITGASISTAQAYIADITTPETRAQGLGMIGAAFGLGFMFGPAIGGLLSTISLEAPALVAAALSMFNFVFGLTMLQESLPLDRRTAFSVSRLNPLARLQGVLGNSNIRQLVYGTILFNFAFAGLQSNFAVYSDDRFGFTATDNAFVFAFIGLVAVITQGWLIRKVMPRFGEARLALVGLALMSASFLMVALAPAGWFLYVATSLLAFGSGLSSPSITSMISRRVSPQEQGVTLGGVQALTSLTMVIGPLFAGYVFAAVGPAAPYEIGAALIVAALVVVGLAVRSSLNLPEANSQPANFSTQE
ncbi:MAG: tetracycline resistance MFS efflux pump [Roseiflexaceae bacterium]